VKDTLGPGREERGGRGGEPQGVQTEKNNEVTYLKNSTFLKIMQDLKEM
jgi:hypothetical protein